MQVETNVLLIPQQTVRGMPLEIVPDLLGWIEFWCIGGKTFDMKPGICLANRIDRRALVDLTPIPEQDDVPAQMPQQHSQEYRDLHGMEVVLPKLDVQAHTRALGRNRKRRERRDPVVLVVVANDWCLSL